MLFKLSLCNAKKQAKSYIFYFLTITLSIAIMLSFNNLIFSDLIAELPNFITLISALIISSSFVVLILCWLICYMTRYMLKKRSHELGIYMVLGITNGTIIKILMYENIVIGSGAFCIGTILGRIISIVSSSLIFNFLGIANKLQIDFSVKAVLLTLIYFVAIFMFAFYLSIKKIRDRKIRDFIQYDYENEQIQEFKVTKALIFTFILLCTVGILMIVLPPFGQGIDILLALVCFGCALLLFIRIIGSLLYTMLCKSNKWKYENNRLFTLSILSSKINSTCSSLGIISVLFTVSVIAIGLPIGVNNMANYCIDSMIFDISIISKDVQSDLSIYEKRIQNEAKIVSSHDYRIYQSDSKMLTNISLHASKMDPSLLYKEYEYDTVMAASDYEAVCKMLGYEYKPLNDESYYIHAVRGLESDIKLENHNLSNYKINGYNLNLSGIHTSAFNQLEPYGNGYNFIIVVPDYIVLDLPVLYQLYSAITDSEVTYLQLLNMVESNDQLTLLDRNMAFKDDANNYGAGTILNESSAQVAGKWSFKAYLTNTYSILISLMYFALILEITGAAFVSTQLLSDVAKMKWRYSMLSRMGLSKPAIQKTINKYVFFYFITPLIFILPIGSITTYFLTYQLHMSSYPLMRLDNNYWILQAVLISLGIFLSVYIIYFITVNWTYKRNILKNSE